LKYLDLLESCSDVMDAVKFASEELSRFHSNHPKGGRCFVSAEVKILMID
jgi:hypothetical protein